MITCAGLRSKRRSRPTSEKWPNCKNLQNWSKICLLLCVIHFMTLLQTTNGNTELCSPWRSAPPAVPATSGLGRNGPSSRRPWSFPGRTSRTDRPRGCPSSPPAAVYRPPRWPLPCGVAALPGATVFRRGWSGEPGTEAAGPRRRRWRKNGRWGVEEGRCCCCWRGCCWRGSRNFGWSWGAGGGADGGGDGSGWRSLAGGSDRPSETVWPARGGEALEPEQMAVFSVILETPQCSHCAPHGADNLWNNDALMAIFTAADSNVSD